MELKELLSILKSKDTESKEKIMVKGFIPLGEKMRVINKSLDILKEIDNVSEDPRIMVVEKQMCKFFDLMMAYTNIRVNESSRTPEIYDECMMLTLDKYILSHGAKYDYARFEKMFDETSDLGVIKFLTTSFGAINEIQFKDGLEKFSKSLSENKDALKAAGNMFAINNPSIKTKKNKK